MNERSLRAVSMVARTVRPCLALLVACSSAGNPSIRPPAPSFNPGALVDVVSPDRIEAIDEPRFDDVQSATWLEPAGRVLAIEHRGLARAYPLAILLVHEVVNDDLAGDPVVVTFAPLCGAAVVYLRTVDGREHVFGVSGKLYRSDLVLFDRETTSLWSQIDGRALLGDLSGSELRALPSQVMTLAEFRARHPSGQVLARPAAADGTPPRIYDEVAYRRFEAGTGPDRSLLAETPDDRLGRMDRVVGVRVGSTTRAYPHDELERLRVINDLVDGRPLVVAWDERAGAAGVFIAKLDGRPVRFESRGGSITDGSTHSAWTPAGVAVAGRLEGLTLEPVHHLDAFWFAWSAFFPQTDVWSEGPVG